MKIIGPKHLKRSAHLGAIKKALRLHDIVEKRELVLGDEELELARFGKISLRRKKG